MPLFHRDVSGLALRRNSGRTPILHSQIVCPLIVYPFFQLALPPHLFSLIHLLQTLPRLMSSNNNLRPSPIGTLVNDGNLELVGVLGYGGYGIVYRAVDC
jgi:hypothetical protein